MAGRTFAIGDIHGDLAHLERLLAGLPPLDQDDTLVFLGDYLDRGPSSAQVVALLRALPQRTPARVVTLRGSHEDAWLRVREQGWIEFILPVGNGCLATYRSFTGGKAPSIEEFAAADEMKAMLDGSFFPAEVIDWMAALPKWYEDAHAIYVHAGLPHDGERWLHPRDLVEDRPLMWQRTPAFFASYQGKRVVFGHTRGEALPQDLSQYTPEDREDMFYRDNLIGVDTGCGAGGFLTAIELPSLHVYETRGAF
jgi:serine/threonine protein phosphatase 1